MPRELDTLPQIGGPLFLTDAGLETDIMFRRGVPLPAFASHTLLGSASGRAVLREYFDEHLEHARSQGLGFVLDTPTWKAHSHWADELGVTSRELRLVNAEAVAFAKALREAHAREGGPPIVVSGLVGPRGDAYGPEQSISPQVAEEYHSEQLSCFAEAGVDMATAMTFGSSSECIGISRAAAALDMPLVLSLTVETDGSLPSGEELGAAIERIDGETQASARYYMLNCAHPTHLRLGAPERGWMRRIGGVRCNASKLSHAELDESEELDEGDPEELAREYCELHTAMPWLAVWGGCCGTDIRHIRRIVTALRPTWQGR